MLEITTLGGLSIQRDGELVTRLSTRKVQALLVYLACTRRTQVREVLAEMLWEERTPERALGNLRVALTRLRQQVGDYLTITRDTVVIDPEANVWLDVADLEEKLRAERTGAALELYHGEFLQGFYVRDALGFEDWVAQERERLHLLMVNALHRQVDRDLAGGAFQAGIEVAHRLLAFDPLLESARQQMMLLLAASGQRSAALGQYETCRALLAEELGVEPSAEIRETYELLLKGERPPGIPIAPAARDREPRPVGECPYRGLAAFREEDTPFFFGREKFTEQLSLAVQQQPLVAVIVGSSGSGKSSAVFAGLLPRLRHEGTWLIANFRPGERPFRALAGALLPVMSQEPSDIASKSGVREMASALGHGDLPLADVVGRALEQQPQARRLLLVVDQFEELYTLCPERDVRRRFLDTLLTAVGPAGGAREHRLVLLLTMRADFMGRALAYRPLADALQDGSVMLGPMNREELRRAIERPAAVQGVALEAGLVERILDDVGDEPGNLPLLEFALTLLWERQSYGWLTHAGYEEIGRVEGAVARFADEVYGELSEAQQEGARRLFVQLVRPGEGTEDTRRLASRTELGEENWELAQHLAGKRLVVTGRDDSGSETVEVVHEALIQGWGRLRGWMEADRAFRTWQEHLRAAVRQWEETEQDQGALLRGAPLAEAEGWLAGRGSELSEAERGFIQAGVAQRERRVALREARRQRELEAAQRVAEAEKQRAKEQERRAEEKTKATKRLRWLAAVLAAAVLLAVAAALFAKGQQQQAQEQAAARATEVVVRTTAEADSLVAKAAAEEESARAGREARLANARAVAAAATGNLDADPELSVLLAMEAVSMTYTVDGTVTREAENALRQAVLASRVLLTLHHGDVVLEAAFSPDGTRIATGSMEGTAEVWDAATGEVLLTLSGHTGPVGGIAFSPDGTRLATASEDYTARVWDVSSGEELLRVGHSTKGVREVWDVAFSPDGKRLATCGRFNKIRVWDTGSGEELLILSGHENMVYDVDFSPDGTRLATASEDGTARVWDSSSGEELLTLTAPDVEWVNSVAFSPDGRSLAMVGSDGTLRVWDVSSGEEILSLAGLGRQNEDVAFSPDGTRLVTSGASGLVSIWDASSGREVMTLAGHSSHVNDATFSPDGTRLVTASEDGTARVWDTTPSREWLTLTGHTDCVTEVAFSPDGTRLATAGYDTTARIWDISAGLNANLEASAAAATNEAQLILSGHKDHVYDLDFSPDGRRLATASLDQTAKVWDAFSGEELFALEGHTDCVTGVDYSPDGTRLATASRDHYGKVWDAATGQELRALVGHQDELWDVTFSPDGTRLATACYDGTAKVWDEATGIPFMTLNADSLYLFRAVYSPDGTLLATAGSDGTVRIWDLESSAADRELLTLAGHSSQLTDLAFSPDGTQLATSSYDGTAKVWDISTVHTLSATEGLDGELAAPAATSGQELLNLADHTDMVADVAFSPDGTRLATASFDGTVRVYLLSIEELVALARGRVTRSLTDEECRQYLHVEECPRGP
jgi:WD40 repeat protein/DNA-binding SARP family transcriptional activator